MDALAVWNLINIAVLVAVVVYCVAYYSRHAGGKKVLRLLDAVVLSVPLLLRISLATGWIDPGAFQSAIRPWAVLVYSLPALDVFVDWKGGRK